jgi:hypothetical protein
MSKVLRGYAKRNDGTLVLVGTVPVPHSKDKSLPESVRKNDIWSGKGQRFLCAR